MKTYVLLKPLILFAFVLIILSCKEDEQFYSPMIQDQTMEVSELAENGSVVGKVQCFDIYEVNSLEYKIIGGNEFEIFQLDSLKGMITIVKKEAIDIDTQHEFNLQIQIKNIKGQLSLALVTIKILKKIWQEPLIANQEFSLLKNAKVGTQIGKVLGLDLYDTDSLKYSIVGGNPEEVFSIDTDAGTITLIRDDFLSNFMDSVITLIVKVTNIKGQSDNGTITIIIRDSEYFAPMIQDQLFELKPDAKTGSVVGKIVAMDVYDTHKLIFRFAEDELNSTFAIDSLTGIVTFIGSDPTIEIDNPEFIFTVQVENIHNQTSIAEIKITIISEIDLENGLVLYLPFDGDVKDKSKSLNHGINYSRDAYVQGIKGLAIDFDGINDYIQLSKHIDSSSGLSFSFWIKKRQLQSDQRNGTIIAEYNMSGFQKGFSIVTTRTYDNSDHRLITNFYANNSKKDDAVVSYYTSSEMSAKDNSYLYNLHKPNRLELDKWTHCIVNTGDNDIQIWLDGTLCVSKEREYKEYSSYQNEPIYIGNILNGGIGSNNHFNGLIDEFRIYNRGLTMREIQALYKE